MFDIIYYENERGEKPVKAYIEELSQKPDKDARIIPTSDNICIK